METVVLHFVVVIKSDIVNYSSLSVLDESIQKKVTLGTCKSDTVSIVDNRCLTSPINRMDRWRQKEERGKRKLSF